MLFTHHADSCVAKETSHNRPNDASHLETAEEDASCKQTQHQSMKQHKLYLICTVQEIYTDCIRALCRKVTPLTHIRRLTSVLDQVELSPVLDGRPDGKHHAVTTAQDPHEGAPQEVVPAASPTAPRFTCNHQPRQKLYMIHIQGFETWIRSPQRFSLVCMIEIIGEFM